MLIIICLKYIYIHINDCNTNVDKRLQNIYFSVHWNISMRWPNKFHELFLFHTSQIYNHHIRHDSGFVAYINKKFGLMPFKLISITTSRLWYLLFSDGPESAVLSGLEEPLKADSAAVIECLVLGSRPDAVVTWSPSALVVPLGQKVSVLDTMYGPELGMILIFKIIFKINILNNCA